MREGEERRNEHTGIGDRTSAAKEIHRTGYFRNLCHFQRQRSQYIPAVVSADQRCWSEDFYEENFVSVYAKSQGYAYAICLKSDGIPIGYIHVSPGESHDLGYGLRREFWHCGIAAEAARAVIHQVKEDGFPYVTATHDVNNPRSGHVMQAVGMRYQYSYEEMWQPKNFLVTFRMYQLNLDGNDGRVYRKYWDSYDNHFVETL